MPKPPFRKSSTDAGVAAREGQDRADFRTAAAGPAWMLLAILVLLLLPRAGHAERADKDKPIQADSDKLTLDNLKKISVFEGNVVIVQGTLRITGDRVELKEDKDGNRHASGVGHQATYRQKRDDVDEYVDGNSDRFEYDAKNNLLELYGHANLRRGLDDVKGDYISYDTRTEFFKVNGNVAGGEGTGGKGRVHVIMQPAPQKPAPPGAPLDLKRDPGPSGQP